MLRRLNDDERNQAAAATATYGLTLQGGSVDDSLDLTIYYLSVDSIGATHATSLLEELRIALNVDKIVLN